MKIAAKLKELDNQLEQIKAPVLSYFKNGLEEKDITGLFDKTGLMPTEEVIEFYQWRNGLEYEDIPSGRLLFGVGGVFFSLQDSIHIYNRGYNDVGTNYFPLFSDDSFLIDLDRDSPGFGKIFIYCPSLLIMKPESYFDSLETMIETFTQCFKNGIFTYDGDGYFEEDSDKSHAIMKSLNPNSKYWLD